ncbi:MAG TPA: amino acid ABC transporter permease [Candidatus Limiplasma sp.]|nr:amino acid ABC transporter permease [Candidatus Limiplasma sp.]
MQYLNNPELLMKLLSQLSEGMLTSLSIFFCTLLFSLPLGLLVALGRMSKRKWLSAPVSFYILIMRGTPLMLQLFTVYFFLPKLVGPIPRLQSTLIAFTFNYAAYFAEIYRGGIMSIDKGQYEAAQVLGFTRAQTFMQIVMPQTIKRVLLPVSNEVITLVKDTSLATAIAVRELFLVAKNATSSSGSVEPLFIAGLFYLAMNTIVTFFFSWLTRRFDYYRG